MKNFIPYILLFFLLLWLINFFVLNSILAAVIAFFAVVGIWQNRRNGESSPLLGGISFWIAILLSIGALIFRFLIK